MCRSMSSRTFSCMYSNWWAMCSTHYTKLHCPHSGYCRKDNNSCHYDTPHSGDGPSMKSCTTNADCKCPGGDYCHNTSTCHLTQSDGNCQKPPPPTPGCGGTCPASICPFTDSNKGKATCGDNCFCKQCYSSKGQIKKPAQKCKPKEEYTEGVLYGQLGRMVGRLQKKILKQLASQLTIPLWVVYGTEKI